MKMIWAERVKFTLEMVKFRAEQIGIYSNIHTLDWQKQELKKLDDYLIKELAALELLLDEEKEAV